MAHLHSLFAVRLTVFSSVVAISMCIFLFLFSFLSHCGAWRVGEVGVFVFRCMHVCVCLNRFIENENPIGTRRLGLGWELQNVRRVWL